MSKPIIIEISDHQKKVLGIIGRAPYGRELVDIVAKVRDQLCSLNSVDRGVDYNVQVEGRLLFKDFADELIDHLTREQRIMKPLETEQYE